MVPPTIGVPPAGVAAAIASDSAVSCTGVTVSTPTHGVETTPQYPSVLNSVSLIVALLPDKPANASFSAFTVVSQRDGWLGSLRFGSASQSATSCTGGALHAMLPLRSTTNKMLDG